MKVFKFGGTSVGSPDNMRSVMDIITDGEPKVVVLSAMSGTTNALVEISNRLYAGNKEEAREQIAALKIKYDAVVQELYRSTEYKEKGQTVVEERFAELYAQVGGEFTTVKEQINLAQGELISTALVTYLLQENGIRAALVPALDFMRIDEEKQADLPLITRLAKPACPQRQKQVSTTC
ncbi:MAG TPA: aspartate kinase, partial [Prolixibacteraceae bacterium]|nr:aspartate kinase [Prolixibacteraceae bacterium]